MLTNSEAAALLTRATSRAGRHAILRALSFDPPVGPLDDAACARLGPEGEVRRAEVCAGPGTLRALIVTASPGVPIRDALGRAARRLAAHSPELLWLLLGHGSGADIGIAIPAPGGMDGVAALLIDTAQVRPADAESFAALVANCGAVDLDTHLRWREALGRDTLTRRFYRDLESAVRRLAEGANGPGSADVRQTLALRCVSRLLFLAFLEAKGWLDGDRAFLSRQVQRCGSALHRRLLDPLFFGTLNTPVSRRAPATRAFGRVPFLNGGLFTRDPMEGAHRQLRFADADIAHVIDHLLGRYRITAREGDASFADAAVDPEMLGRAFESLMAGDDRRNSGAFYTPPALIAHVFDEALDAAIPVALHPTLTAARAGHVEPSADATTLRDLLGALRMVDPACGTGAFLVHALTRLSALMEATHDPRSEHVRRRALLARGLFGVDINPTAVWLCELRLWLAVVVDLAERDPLKVPPLPNLDRNIRCADALAGPGFDATPDTDAGIARLRERYARATGVRKRTLQRELDRAERRAAIALAQHRIDTLGARRRDLLAALRTPDLFGGRRVAMATERAALTEWRVHARSLRRALAALRAGGAVPFAFPVHFADVAKAGGFDLVIGNPPWVRLHRIPPADRDRLRATYQSFRDAAWRAGAAASGAMTGFAMQADLSALFTERSVQLLRPAGVSALLVPSKLFRSLAGGGLRSVLQNTTLVVLEDHAEGRALFDAAVYPALLVVRRETAAPATRSTPAAGAAASPDVACAVVKRDTIFRWRSPRRALPLDVTPGAPWLLLPPPARAAFDALAARGITLADSPFGRPVLGVKSGCNDAFVVHAPADWTSIPPHASVEVTAGDRTARIERSMLRPLLRGEDLAPFVAAGSSQAIVWTHDAALDPLTALPALAGRWLSHWRPTLARRSDARSNDRWWSLYRLDAARTSWRVVWGDLGRTPRALVLRPDDPTVPLNSCYALCMPSEDDADALCAWLNAPLATAWLSAIAEPARGGFRRFLGWTMARLPFPADWPRAREVLAPLGRAARDGEPIDESRLNMAALHAFGLPLSSVEPLFTWMQL